MALHSCLPLLPPQVVPPTIRTNYASALCKKKPSLTDSSQPTCFRAVFVADRSTLSTSSCRGMSRAKVLMAALNYDLNFQGASSQSGGGWSNPSAFKKLDPLPCLPVFSPSPPEMSRTNVQYRRPTLGIGPGFGLMERDRLRVGVLGRRSQD